MDTTVLVRVAAAVLAVAVLSFIVYRRKQTNS